MSEQPQKMTDGIRQELRTERQAATATKDKTGPRTDKLMEEVLRRENLSYALKRVQANKGAPGVDGMSVEELPAYLKKEWPRIRKELSEATYIPLPARRKDIPKPGGGSRMLGIPTAVDRFIGQAILQVLAPIFDSHFSEFSYGFRPGRSALMAVKQARNYIRAGHRWVVDLDLEKFFDRVNHDILMSRLARRIEDKRLLKLIRRYLEAGIMAGGIVEQHREGTPQGSPLSPLLSNILLDEFDKELERRGHTFCRYADDCNIYVRSRKAGERVMRSITRFLERRLKLKVNRQKSAVARPWRRKFLGYSVTIEYKARLKPAAESVKRAKVRIRQITGRRARGRNILKVMEELNLYLRGWGNYFRLAEVKQPFDILDQWIRRRLRKLLWRQWKKPKTRYKKMVQLGVKQERAKKAAAGGRGPWYNAGASHMHAAVPNRLLKEWGLLSLLQKHRQTLLLSS
ncbi:MAG: group II intron reverse transcriptase/maturase [Chloroflexi bacterium]|nr:group II intron reverse transcriptase/maturase [Chloroflexota bacterium]